MCTCPTSPFHAAWQRAEVEFSISRRALDTVSRPTIICGKNVKCQTCPFYYLNSLLKIQPDTPAACFLGPLAAAFAPIYFSS